MYEINKYNLKEYKRVHCAKHDFYDADVPDPDSSGGRIG